MINIFKIKKLMQSMAAANVSNDIFVEAYNQLISSLPPVAGNFLNLFLAVLLVVVSVMFIWKLDSIISRKNVFDLNLNKYKNGEYTTYAKFYASLLYLLEYLVIIPFFIFFWFSAFALFIIIFTDNLSIDFILFASAAIVASVRMMAYYNEKISDELAKLLPLNLLAYSIITSNVIGVQKIASKISELPGVAENAFIYLGFIIVIEGILRFFEFVFSLFGIDED